RFSRDWSSDVCSSDLGEIELVQRAFDEFRDLHGRKIIEDELLWRALTERYGEYFEGGMGAEAIASLIARIDLDEEEVKLRDAIRSEERRVGQAWSERR